MNAEENVFKPDVTAIRAFVKRGSGGTIIQCRTIAPVEEFFKTNSGEDPRLDDVRLLGRHWVSTNLDKPMPNVYKLPADKSVAGTIPFSGSGGFSGFRLNRPGSTLVEYRDDVLGGSKTINLSFLRMSGISSENGIEFLVKGVYSEEMIKQIYDAISVAGAAFYKAFLKPISLEVYIMTREY